MTRRDAEAAAQHSWILKGGPKTSPKKRVSIYRCLHVDLSLHRDIVCVQLYIYIHTYTQRVSVRLGSGPFVFFHRKGSGPTFFCFSFQFLS